MLESASQTTRDTNNILPGIAHTGRAALLLLVTFVLLAVGPALAQPGFVQSFSPATIGPGSVSTLAFDITNGTGSPVSDLAFSNSLPAGVTLASPPRANSSCGGDLMAASGGSLLTFQGGSVPGFRSCRVRVDVTSSVAGTHNNTSGALTSSAGSSGTSSADLTVATDRPGFSQGVSPATQLFGGRSRLTFTIDNTQNAQVANNLTFTENFPSAVRIASPANATKTCSGGSISAPGGGSTLSYSPLFFGDASVAAGSSCTVGIDVILQAVGTHSLHSEALTSTPPFSGTTRSSGSANSSVTVEAARLTLEQDFVNDPSAPGSVVTLQFLIRNLDRDFAAESITFSHDLDAVLSGLTALGLPSANPCGAGSTLTGTQVITLSGGNIPAQGTCQFTLEVAVPTTASNGAYSSTTSAIDALVDGAAVTGLPATDTLFVEAAPALTKNFIGDPMSAGSDVELEFTLTNTSPDYVVTDIAFEDVFGVELPTAASVPAADFCGVGSSANYTPLFNSPGSGSTPARLTISNASLPAAGSCTFSIVLNIADGTPGGFYPNTTSTVSAIVDGASVEGRPATDTLEIVTAPRLTLEFTNDPVSPGNIALLEYTLRHGDLDHGDASGITFTHDLSNTLSGLEVSSLPASGFCGPGSQISGTTTILVTDALLAPGTSCTFTVDLTTPANAAPGPYTSQTSFVMASVVGVNTSRPPASGQLRIAGLVLSKEFIDDPVLPGGTVTLRYTIDNDHPILGASDIAFLDDLDAAVDNMAATSLPPADPCGTGSTLTTASADRLLIFQGGSLDSGLSCTFDVELLVPAATPADSYQSNTGPVSATVGGETVLFDSASDELVVNDDFLVFSKEFLAESAAPGGSVGLRFSITNLHSASTLVDIEFDDDLGAALPGLVSTSGTVPDVCGLGSQIAGTDLLTFAGGSLGPGASCQFDVTVTLPASVTAGAVVHNVTSPIAGTLGSATITGGSAVADLAVNVLEFSKTFVDSVSPGGIVALSFTISNPSLESNVEGVSFNDDLEAVVTGLQAVGLAQTDICGPGSLLTTGSTITVSGASLLPGGSCTFEVEVETSAATTPGVYQNVTSELRQSGLPVAPAATANLTVVGTSDADDDGVLDEDDLCPDTVIPEGVPTVSLGT
ncbi:MAG: hypothetical protein K8J08_18535, partial [Thermoanaerobaculia bacterium]|nr:hypothetical protein [Thermoanaerobaculia bacterium]